jgi:hypothetical protein
MREKAVEKNYCNFAKCHAFQIIYSRALYAADEIGASLRGSHYMALHLTFRAKKREAALMLQRRVVTKIRLLIST